MTNENLSHRGPVRLLWLNLTIVAFVLVSVVTLAVRFVSVGIDNGGFGHGGGFGLWLRNGNVEQVAARRAALLAEATTALEEMADRWRRDLPATWAVERPDDQPFDDQGALPGPQQRRSVSLARITLRASEHTQRSIRTMSIGVNVDNDIASIKYLHQPRAVVMLRDRVWHSSRWRDETARINAQLEKDFDWLKERLEAKLNTMAHDL